MKIKDSLKILMSGLFILISVTVFSQKIEYAKDVTPSRFDYGKMWTFEYAPLDYFEKTYDFRPDEAWLEHARMSALRFSSYCSASFISANGLVMTNHHCSRGEVGSVMGEGEDFDKNGFYATSLEEERKVEGLFVKQLVRIADVTQTVKEAVAKAADEQEAARIQEETLNELIAQYGEKAGWEGLEVEPVDYYSGGRFSLYGYKRYDDVRLVLIPELQLAFFGGDDDNFTYPRYNLDCTLWRIYENGKPLNTKDFYFKVNVDGVKDGEPVFVVGNPASTERYRTMAQLEFDRDYRYKILLEWLSNRKAIMETQLADNYSHDIQEMIFNFANSIKAIDGIVKGMYDPYLMGKKQAMEDLMRGKSKTVAGGNDYWQQLADTYKPLEGYSSELRFIGNSPFGGAALQLAHATYGYIEALDNETTTEADLKAMKEQILALGQELEGPYEKTYLTTLLTELQKYARSDDAYMKELLGGNTPERAAADMLKETAFSSAEGIEKMLDKKAKKLKNSKDPIIRMGQLLVPEYNKAIAAFSASAVMRNDLASKISNEVFSHYGLDIPPDATFTLRLADGVVQSYNYNGTKAPLKTTYYGLYDRNRSFDNKFPWALPERWNNAPRELMEAPLNFVSTNDIIGGNSGSPIINKKGEVVGLIFDGNIESLPGNFIYDEKVNRAVSLHAGGMIAALKYIYRADRLLKELGVE
ncbi:MAG: S46 family peptidase [Saprospiraceae bacterium]|nr:S46 family peptidase [Saprospiraceae bacterium]MCB9324948.1 S46 family peptidase [Lewinellaceae bacterium]